MQKPLITLNEIVWEITGRCEKNCYFCGSADVKDSEIDEDKIKKIADAIIKFPPRNIDISGGDPLLVSRATHEYITDLFRTYEISHHIIVNPFSITKENINTLALYDLVGISCNSKGDLQRIKDLDIPHSNVCEFALITNFNLNNFFSYNEIEEYVKDKGISWQIQYTVFREYNPLALYENEEALIEFSKRVEKSINSGIAVVISDNMNGNRCFAGTYSIGITQDGKVLPCLSMRSWKNEIDSAYAGDILKHGLKEIWENNFNDYRFSTFGCCKDVCKNKVIATYELSKATEKESIEIKETTIEDVIELYKKQTPKFPGQVVFPEMPANPPPVFVYYGVFTGVPTIVAYAITAPAVTTANPYKKDIWKVSSNSFFYKHSDDINKEPSGL